MNTGGVPSGAHGTPNKEHQVCARRRAGEAAGSPLRIFTSRERRLGTDASQGEEAVLADSGREGEINRQGRAGEDVGIFSSRVASRAPA